jgi:acyl carrier protein
MKNIAKSDIVDFNKKEVTAESANTYHEIDVDTPFADFRMDSLRAVYIMDRLEKFVGEELSPLYFWEHPTIASLSAFISLETTQK